MSHLPTNTPPEQVLIDALKQLDDDLKKYIDEQINQKVAGLQQEIVKLNDQITSVNTKINTNSSTVGNLKQKDDLEQRQSQPSVEVQKIESRVTGLQQKINILEQKLVKHLLKSASYSEVIKHLRNQDLQLKNPHINLDNIDTTVQKNCSKVVLTQSGTNISIDEKRTAILLVLLFLLHKSNDKITEDKSKSFVIHQMNHATPFGFSEIIQLEIFQEHDKCFELIFATAKVFRSPDVLPGGSIDLLYNILNNINNRNNKPLKSQQPN